MLVLSRKVDESLIFGLGDSYLLTLKAMEERDGAFYAQWALAGKIPTAVTVMELKEGKPLAPVVTDALTEHTFSLGKGSRIHFTEDIFVEVLDIRDLGKVRVGVKMPKDWPVYRYEIYQQITGHAYERDQ